MFHNHSRTRNKEECAKSSSFDSQLLTRNQNQENSHDHHHYHQQEEQLRRSIPNVGEVHWFLFQKTGTISLRLSRHQPTLIGREECDISIESPSVEKRHAVLAFEPNSNCFTVRDLNTTNGTYLNNRRISADHPETLSNLDLLRFGYVRSASLAGTRSASSFPFKIAKDRPLEKQDNTERLPKPNSSSFLPKTLLTVTKSDPSTASVIGNGTSEVLRDRLNYSRSSNSSNCTGPDFHATSAGILENHQRQYGGDRHSLPQPRIVMQQGARSGGNVITGLGTSRVCSPSLTFDSGRGSSSAPSSPAKEMSPVQMSGSSAGVGVTQGPSSMATSSSSQNCSPVFARKLSRPMEYLLGQQGDQHEVEPGFVPDNCVPVDVDNSRGSSNGGVMMGSLSVNSDNFGNTDLMSEPTSFTSATYNQNVENNNNTNNNHGFPSNGDCEILQITEDYDDIVGDDGRVVRKDSLEEVVDVSAGNCDSGIMMSGRSSHVDSDVLVINGDIGGVQMQPQFLVGGDIMQPDLNVPNEVFGPLSHAEILNRNISCNNNLNAIGKQGTKQVDLDTCFSTAPTTRARSSSGDGGSSRSTPMSALYGTPHWWPESPPPDENGCPPPPVSSSNSSPLKKSFLLNNHTLLTNSAAAIRFKGNSSSSSLTDPPKELSLESAHSQKSIPTAAASLSPVPASGGGSGGGVDPVMEMKKFTPMAFTIDFSDSDGGGAASAAAEAASAKKAAIAERLSKFAPRHKRQASSAQSEDLIGKEGDSSSSSSKPVRGTNSLGRNHQRQSSVGTTAAESSAPAATSRTGSLPKKLSGAKHPSGESSSTNNNDTGLRPISPETISSTTSSSSRSRPLESSSKINTSKISSSSRDNSNLGSLTNQTSKSLQQKSHRIGSKDTGNGIVSGSTRKSPPVGLLYSSSRNRSANHNNLSENKGEKSVTPLNDLSKEPTMTSATMATPVTQVGDKEDTVSEAGTYTVEKEVPEVETARENIEEVFGLTPTGDGDALEKENNLGNESNGFGGAEPGTRDWVREWAELAAQQHQQKQRPELPETQYFLRETETLVTAIQERVSKHMKSGEGASGAGSLRAASDSEDEPTLAHHTPVKSLSQHSTPTNMKKRPPSRSSPFHRESSVLSDSGYAIGYQSDSSNEGSREPLAQSVATKMSRAFKIRRGGRVGYDSEGYASEQLLMMNHQQSMTLPPLNGGVAGARGISSKTQVSKYQNLASGRGAATATTSVNTSSPSTSLFSRNDGGRFSLRMPKSRTPPAQMPPPAPRQIQNSFGRSTSDADSHGSGRVMNGIKSDSQTSSKSASKKGAPSSTPKLVNSAGGKKPGNRSNSTLTAKEVEMANWKRRKNYDPMKAAAADGKKNRKTGASSGTESGVEDVVPLPPISSPKVNRREGLMTKSLSFHQESYSPKCVSEDEDMIYIVDEIDSSHSNSPNHLGGMTRSYHEDVMYYGMPMTSTPMRQKNKLEALDNLVIATIHSLSSKVRTSSRHLLEKLQARHPSDENGALLEEMVSQLKELEGPSNNVSPNKSPSRELSGTLKNLKKLEQVVLVLDKVLCDDFESDVNG